MKKPTSKSPLANTSPEAVALRKAAVQFARCVAEESEDDFDLAGQARNRALLKAALAYAEAVKA